MRVDLNALPVEELVEMLPQINDLKTLRAAAKKETREPAKRLFEERIGTLQGSEGPSAMGSSSVSATREAPKLTAPVGKPAIVRVKLVRGLSYHGRGVSFQQGEVRSVESDLARSLLGTGLFEEVIFEERRE